MLIKYLFVMLFVVDDLIIIITFDLLSFIELLIKLLSTYLIVYITQYL